MSSNCYGPYFQINADQEVHNEAGIFELIELATDNVQLSFPGTEALEQNLKLIYGVGEVTSAQLNAAGYHSLKELLAHPKWQHSALELLKIIGSKNIERLIRYGASDMELLSFFKPEEVKFVDIETIGLYYINPVFLVGILFFKDGQGVIKQFFARDYTEEKAILRQTSLELSGAKLITSFNGRSFDLPYLKGRMRFYNMEDIVQDFHFDLLRSARKNYRKSLPNCRLLTIEKYLLAQEREDDIPGSEIADYYNRFVESKDRVNIEGILKHNALDLLSMAKFMGILTTISDNILHSNS